MFLTIPHRYFAALVKKLNTPAPVQVSGAFAGGGKWDGLHKILPTPPVPTLLDGVRYVGVLDHHSYLGGWKADGDEVSMRLHNGPGRMIPGPWKKSGRTREKMAELVAKGELIPASSV
jgi:hypothetical protein